MTGEWGTTFGDLTSAPFLLWGVCLLLCADKSSSWRVVFAGIFVGLAVGLKLTNGPCAVASICLAVFLFPRVGMVARFIAGQCIGFTVAAGPWMVVMLHETANPLFPLFNNVFRSPYIAPSMARDGRFGGDGVSAALLLPFKLVAAPAGLTGELPSSDWRWPVWAVSAVVILFLLALQLPGSPIAAAQIPRSWMWREPAFRKLVGLQLFLLVSFLLWARVFGIQRYAIVIEILVVPAIVAVLALLTQRVTGMAVLTLLLVAGLGLNTVTVNMGRLPMPDGPAIPVGSRPQLQTYATIIIAETHPITYMAVAAGGSVKSGTRPRWLGKPYTDADLSRGLARRGRGKVGVLVHAGAGDPVAEAQTAAEWYGYGVTGTCTPLVAPLTDPMLICDVRDASPDN